MKWYRKAAEEGNAAAQVNLGIAYASGSGWKCNDGYYRANQNCRKLPPNGVARYDGEDFSDGKGLDCESGYEKNKFKIGDTVRIEESKPYSKNKQFKVLEESK